MEIFYKDKKEKFECDIDVDGASINETKARLTLEFEDSDTKYLFEGTVNEDGICTVDIPKLKHTPSNGGFVTLEVIAESTFFEPWTDSFVVKQSKNVTVKRVNERVEKKKDNDIKVNVKGTTLSEKAVSNKEAKSLFSEEKFIKYISSVVNDERLVEEYSTYEPKIITEEIAKAIDIKESDNNYKAKLFYIEKNII